MKVSEEFSGKYFKAADFPNPKVLVMSSDTKETMPDTKIKSVLWFQDQTKGLVLNPTNANEIAKLYGDDSAVWPGKLIELYATTTDFAGKIVPCVRVRAPQQAVAVHSLPIPLRHLSSLNLRLLPI